MPYELPTAGGRIPYGRAFGKKEFILPKSAQNLIRRESHKEGPTAGGRIPYECASGKKEFILPKSAQNPIRKESHKEGLACGRIPYEIGCLPYKLKIE